MTPKQELKFRGDRYKPGDTVEGVPEPLAQRWVNQGVARVYDPPDKETATDKQPKEDATDSQEKETAEDGQPETENRIAFDDLEQKQGGHYYLPNGEYLAHGEDKAREKLKELNGG